MDRRADIDALRDALSSAAGARDWDGLCTAVSALAPRLAELGAQGPWSAAEMRALARLRTSHDLAATVCQHQQQELLAKMTELQDNKTGWTAYALDHETELDENPA
ncbi:MAG TPA: hypothetical protein VGD30_03260 [Telluria sp.]